MTERKHAARLFRPQLASLRLRSCDVEVFAKLYERTDSQAATDLIDVNFNGGLIEDRHIGHKRRQHWKGLFSTRKAIAEDVFREYFGRTPREEATLKKSKSQI